jgi:hypothetical protein
MLAITALAVSLCYLQAPAGDVPPGTPIKLTLLRPLESGKTRVHSNVPFAVTEDVVGSDGAVLLPKGSYAVGTVTASRAEGPLSATVLDRPARLIIRFDYVFDADNEPIPLLADLKKDSATHSLSREYTSMQLKEDQALALALKQKRHRELLEKLVHTLSNEGFNPSAEDEAVLLQLLESLEMRDTTEVVRQGKLRELLTLMRNLANARTTKTLIGNTSFKVVPSALNAVSEVVKLGTRGVGFLKSKLKGRNIRAYPGCDFTVYVGKQAR